MEFVEGTDLGKYVRAASGGTTLVRIPVRFLQINHEAVLWGAPLEVFCEIAIDVRNSSRFPFTFFFGLTNGWIGPTPICGAWTTILVVVIREPPRPTAEDRRLTNGRPRKAKNQSSPNQFAALAKVNSRRSISTAATPPQPTRTTA